VSLCVGAETARRGCASAHATHTHTHTHTEFLFAAVSHV